MTLFNSFKFLASVRSVSASLCSVFMFLAVILYSTSRWPSCGFTEIMFSKGKACWYERFYWKQPTRMENYFLCFFCCCIFCTSMWLLSINHLLLDTKRFKKKIKISLSLFLLVSFFALWHSETCLLQIEKVLGKNPWNMTHVQEKSQHHA